MKLFKSEILYKKDELELYLTNGPMIFFDLLNQQNNIWEVRVIKHSMSYSELGNLLININDYIIDSSIFKMDASINLRIETENPENILENLFNIKLQEYRVEFPIPDLFLEFIIDDGMAWIGNDKFSIGIDNFCFKYPKINQLSIQLTNTSIDELNNLLLTLKHEIPEFNPDIAAYEILTKRGSMIQKSEYLPISKLEIIYNIMKGI